MCVKAPLHFSSIDRLGARPSLRRVQQDCRPASRSDILVCPSLFLQLQDSRYRHIQRQREIQMSACRIVAFYQKWMIPKPKEKVDELRRLHATEDGRSRDFVFV